LHLPPSFCIPQRRLTFFDLERLGKSRRDRHAPNEDRGKAALQKTGNPQAATRAGNDKMKILNKIFSISLTLAATLIGSPMFHAQDWQTVDDFAPVGGSAQALGVATDANSGIYVVGTAD
jgi:hypothetical protein